MMEGSTWRIIGAMVQLLLLISMISCSPARQQQETEGQHRIFRRSANQEETSGTSSSSQTPLHYKLKFTPNLEAATFQGRVQITFISTVETETVTLHADKELAVTQMKLDAVDSSNLQAVDIIGKSRDADEEWLVITLAKKLDIGVNYQLTLDFNGKHPTAKAEGFVMRSYECSITNETRWFAGTQMPNRKARSVFPCFDDPMFKTPFEVSVARKEGYNTLSNTLLRASEPDPDDAALMWDHFLATPPISTFSVGVIVSDSVFVTPSEHLNNGNLRVFGRPGTEIHLQTTANLAQEMVTKIESYLGMPLPFSKLDIVVVPSGTSARLFEYAGVLLFWESELADKQAEYSLGIQLARQWFVHMSSPVSWNAVVDASALGTFVDIASGAFVPPWVVETGWPKMYYFIDEVVAWPEHSSKTAMGMWILEMINYTISEESFKKGLHNFLEERKYKSYTNEDLLAALDSAAPNEGTDLSASEIVKQWFNNSILPVVTITRDYESRTADIKQNVFTTSCPHDFMHNPNNLTWTIPLMYFTEGNQEISSQSPVTWMNNKEITVTDMPETDKFIVVNPKGIGLYLVNYDQHNWAMIAQYLAEDPTRMTEATRYNLLHNAWNLGLAGVLDFNSVLDMTLFLPKERTWSVWNNFHRMQRYLASHLGLTPAGKKFDEYSILLTKNLLESLREPTHEHNEEIIKIRDSARDVWSDLSDEIYAEKAGTYEQWIEDMDPSEDISADNLAVLCTIIRWGSNEEWDLCFNKLFNSTSTDNPSWRQSFASRFPECSEKVEQSQRFLKAIFLENAEFFTDDNKMIFLFQLAHVNGGMKNMLTFLRGNWNALKHSLESNQRLWIELVAAATEHFKTQEDLNKVVELYEERKGEFGVAKEVIERSIMKVTKELEWSNRNHPVIEAWLDHKLPEMRN